MRFGAPEIIIVLVIILIIFGVGKLPQIGGAIGKSIREFRKQQSGEDSKEGDVSKASEKEAKETKTS
jgi:sec-independent protein translocase protein TatA